MAEPRDSASFLEDVSDIAQTQYFPNFDDQTGARLSMVTNKLFKPDSQEVTGTGKVFQVEAKTADNVRFSTDPMAQASPDMFQPKQMTVRFNKDDPTLSDFSSVDAAFRTTDIDIKEAGKGSIVDFVERMYKNIMPQFEYSLAVHRHLGRTARVALVNGTPVTNAAKNYVSTAGAGSNTVGIRFPVDNGSIAAIRPGHRLDIYNGTTGVITAGNVEVTDVNVADRSIGVKYNSAGFIATRTSTGGAGALAAVADNDVIYYSGEKNKGMYSFGAYLTLPAAFGDSFIGGKDRQDKDFRWLNPTTTREAETSNARLTQSMFNDLAIAMGFIDEEHGVVCMSDPTLHQAIRDAVGEDSFINIPTSDSRMERFANFGSVGLNYQHGQFGLVKVVSDPLAMPNRVSFFTPETWRTLFYAWKGLRVLAGDGPGGWYRMTSETPGAGKSKYWQVDWQALCMDFCFQPWKNGQIYAVSAT